MPLILVDLGRSIQWVIDRVINPLWDIIQNKNVLNNLFAVGEKGGTWLTFDSEGAMQHYKDESVSVPQTLQEKVRNLIDSEFSESMFYDETKETMISTEMKDDYDMKEYRKRQHVLNEKLHKLIEQENLGQQLKIDPTTIAVDIENNHVGKGFATERILEWLNKQRIKPKQFIAFGDSPSDVPMAEKLHELGHSVEFIYVGKNNLPKENYPFPVTRTQNSYEQGTLEHLKTV